MRRVRVVCKDGGSAVNLAQGMADNIGRNRSHATFPPAEKTAVSLSVPGPDGGWGPESVGSILRLLRLIVGAKLVDLHIEAQIAQIYSGHGGKATNNWKRSLPLVEGGAREVIR